VSALAPAFADAPHAVPAVSWRERAAAVRACLPGLGAAAILALGAAWIAAGLGDPLARNPVLVAMLTGLLLGGLLGCPQALRPGLDFAKRRLLRLGVMLLGFRITTALLADLGLAPIAIAATELVVVLVVVRWAGVRLFGLAPELALLVAVGSAVCGAAAILSVAALSKSRERHAGPAIALITIAGTLALLLYPVAFLSGWMPGLGEHGFGVTVGASIFELAQVYGASAAVSEGALNVATLVKLCKVLMLIPLLIVLGTRPHAGGAGAAPSRRIPIPWFVIGFLGVLAFNSLVPVHPQARQAILAADQFLFLMVTVSLGLTTPVARLGEAAGTLRLAATGGFALVLSVGVAYALALATQATRAPAPDIHAAPTGFAPGALRFDAVGCGKCHVPTLQGRHGPVLLYSDLLLHDMGPGLDDKIVQGEATGADWRTAPLVGLRLRTRFLHDGRAARRRDAVLEHGGEAEIVRRRFFELEDAEQAAVYAFLGGL